jgi:hypothetical protein
MAGGVYSTSPRAEDLVHKFRQAGLRPCGVAANGLGMHVGPLGVTGLTVSRLGLGAGHLGGPELDERQAGSLLLHASVDMGVSFIDAARHAARRHGARLGLFGRRPAAAARVRSGVDSPACSAR